MRWVTALQIILVLMIVVSSLAWGVYAITYVTPGDNTSTVNSILSQEAIFASNLNGNGTLVRPSTEAQFIIEFQKGPLPAYFASGFNIQGHPGFGMGPILWTSSNSSISSYQRQYAVFGFVFKCKGVCFFATGPNGNLQFSGPEGNITQFMDKTEPVLRQLGTSDTFIVQTDNPGNYTLHYVNQVSSNVTLTVTLGISSIIFTRPYLYEGVASIAITSASSLILRTISWKKSREHSTAVSPT